MHLWFFFFLFFSYKYPLHWLSSGFSFRYSRELRPRLWLPQRGLVQRGSDLPSCWKLSQPPSWIPKGAVLLPISRPDSLRFSLFPSFRRSSSTRPHHPSCSPRKEATQWQPSDTLRRPGFSNALRASPLSLRQRHRRGNARATFPSVPSFHSSDRIWARLCCLWELFRASISSTSTWKEEQKQWVSGLSDFLSIEVIISSKSAPNILMP